MIIYINKWILSFDLSYNTEIKNKQSGMKYFIAFWALITFDDVCVKK